MALIAGLRPEGLASSKRRILLEATCQRCNDTLREADRYCPTCGLPHLTYVAAEAPVIPLGTLADGLAVIQEPIGPVGGVAWRPALSVAIMLAIPAGILCSAISIIGQSLGMVWMAGAAAWAVALYGRRTRQFSITPGAGARIGFVTGIMASWLTLALNGATVWVQRFLMHQGGQMDSDWLVNVDKSLELSQQTFLQMGMAATVAAQSNQISRSWMLSPEGRAGIALFSFLMGAAFLIFFAIIGGALTARFVAQSRRPNA
jgi:hypothetical protein